MVYCNYSENKWGIPMAEIRDFNRNQYLLKGGRHKTKKTEESDKNTKSMNSKLARYRQMKLYTALAIVAVVAAILFGAYIYWKNIEYAGYEIIQQNEWTRAADSKSISVGGTLFTYSNDGMSCTDTKGKMIWNQTYEMQNPIVRTCKKTIAVGDYNGRSIYVANTQGVLGVIDTTKPIRDFCVSENGIVAAVLDNSTITSIDLYSTEGELLVGFTTTMSKSGYPIGIDISNDGGQAAVSYLKAENGKITTSIGFYNFRSVGQQYEDNLVGGNDYADSIVPLVRFMEYDTIFAVADNRIMFYKGKQKPENIMDIFPSEQIQSVFYDEEHVGLVFYNTAQGTTYRVDIYDTNAKKVSEIDFDMEYKEILFDTSGIIIYNESECIIYDWDNRLKFQGNFDDRIICFIPGGSISRHTLITNDMIQQIELR